MATSSLPAAGSPADASRVGHFSRRLLPAAQGSVPSCHLPPRDRTQLTTPPRTGCPRPPASPPLTESQAALKEARYAVDSGTLVTADVTTLGTGGHTRSPPRTVQLGPQAVLGRPRMAGLFPFTTPGKGVGGILGAMLCELSPAPGHLEWRDSTCCHPELSLLGKQHPSQTVLSWRWSQQRLRPPEGRLSSPGPGLS